MAGWHVVSEARPPATPDGDGDDVRRRLAAALLQLPPAVAQLGEVFAGAGYRLALVGGPVRDAALGRIPPDLDFTTDARPDATEALLKAWGHASWNIGKAFGTIGGRRDDVVVEVTTYRSESYASDSRKPEVSYGDSLEGDLLRRDFTVNAMAVELPSMRFVDPFDGLADLAAGWLRTPGAASDSFGDDPLRMMRAARFCAQLGLDVDEPVLVAMNDMAERITIVSPERVRGELEKLLLSSSPRRGLELMVLTGLADHVLPELPALCLEVDEHHRHKDVYEHTLTVLDQAIALEDPPDAQGHPADFDGAVPGPDLVLRLAALLHDIGKPGTRRFEAGGGVSFHHHEMVGAKLTGRRMKALRFDKETTTKVSRLVELHLRFHGYGDGEWTDSAVRRYITDAGPLLSRLHKLTRSDCTTRNQRKAMRLAAAYDDLEDRIARLLQQEELRAVRPDLDGNEIMKLLGLAPGRDVGRAWAFLKELRLDRGPLSREQAQAELVAWWQAQQ
jgi:poly(A) polymerase